MQVTALYGKSAVETRFVTRAPLDLWSAVRGGVGTEEEELDDGAEGNHFGARTKGVCFRLGLRYEVVNQEARQGMG
jgi:hypothetical protein